MGVRQLRFPDERSSRRADPESARLAPVSPLRRFREHAQVAAVCYRVGRKGVEFLLVQTRGSERWTFPKGGAEPGLTHAHAAALEAFEEAGVHGRIEETSFAQYIRTRRSGKKNSNPRAETIRAHLCEVLWLGSPEESGRNPSWFCPEKAKRRLREDRAPEFAAELTRVVDRAVVRIQRLRSNAGTAVDALQRVTFEAFEGTDRPGRVQEAWFTRYIRYKSDGVHRSAAIKLAVHTHLSKVLQFVPPQERNQNAASLSAGDTDHVRAVGRFATRIPQLTSATSIDDNAPQKAEIAELEHTRQTEVRTRALRTGIPRSKRKNGRSVNPTRQR